ncbi:hypothetical protein [Streptomyces sp. SID14478]|uniref:hypothetical protein n=1 Tax=Streptomyces sp. SID14478 TaxID=2706073 RepID=UPI001EF277F3|nr:hypothetical protein [Streptomyces sp. SID14478]
MGLLIIAMDRIEDLMNAEARRGPGRRVRHLRLVPGAGRAGRHRAPRAQDHGEAA